MALTDIPNIRDSPSSSSASSSSNDPTMSDGSCGLPDDSGYGGDDDEYEYEYYDDEAGYDEIELVVEGRGICVSEQLLVKHSKYFSYVFGELDPDVDMVVLKRGRLEGEEGVSEEEEKQPLTHITYDTMRTVVDYMMTEDLSVDEDNMRQLMIASDLLAMEAVEVECFNYLKTDPNLANCVKRYVLADAKPSWSRLAKHLEHFIQLHFDQLMGQTAPKDLITLTSADQFAKIISDESLAVRKEEEVLKAVLEWTNHEWETRSYSLPMLLRKVQWPLVRNRRVLREALFNPTISCDEDCVAIVCEAITYHDKTYEEILAHWRQRDDSGARRKKPSRWPKLLAVLSYCDRVIECFDFEDSRWFKLAEKPTPTFGAEMCYLDGMIYTLGGVQSKRVDQYDLENRAWTQGFPELTQFRVAHGLIPKGNEIFVMGGSAKTSENFGPGLDEMEVLTMQEKEVEESWRMVSSMDVGRSYLASASLDGNIYVVGGCLNQSFSSAEMYDTKTKSWSPVANTLAKRDSLGLAAFDDQLYALGGFNNNTNSYLSSAERYDPDLDAWFAVAPMQYGRRSPGVVVHKSKLYAVGGMGETEDLRSIEVYDPIANHWTKFPHPMREICGWVTACLVEKPLNMMAPYEDDEESKEQEKKRRRQSYAGPVARKGPVNSGRRQRKSVCAFNMGPKMTRK